MVVSAHPTGFYRVKENRQLASANNHLQGLKNQVGGRAQGGVQRDFLSRLLSLRNLARRMQDAERLGTHYWKYYYSDYPQRLDFENKKNDYSHYGTPFQIQAMRLDVLAPKFAYRIVDDMKQPERYEDFSPRPENDVNTENAWKNNVQIAQAALARQDYSQAQIYFRLALNSADAWSPSDQRLQKTLSGLADALSASDKFSEQGRESTFVAADALVHQTMPAAAVC